MITTVSCMGIKMLVRLLGVLAVVKLNLIEKSYTEDNFLSLTPESCTCPGDELVFECTIEGDAGTYWQGTALDECLQSRILIRHSQFHGGGHITRRSCGASGTVVVRTISVVNNSFTTQLTITVNQQLSGSTVECVSDRERIIGMSQISLKTAPSVSSVTLHNVKQREPMFMWINATESCPATSYKIISRNCGDCPHTSNSTFITCNNFSMTNEASICIFTVQSVVCGSILGEAAVPIAVLINGPPPPKITHIEVLHNRSIRTFFNTARTEFRGQCQRGQSPVISYAIKYFDLHANASCGLDIIDASSCIDQICNNVFDLDTLCSNSTSVLVTVSAMNALGDGQESEPITAVLQYTESDGNANYVHQTLGYNTSMIITITVGSILGGIVLLLLLAIILLPLIILTCRNIQSRRFKIQNAGVNFEELMPANGADVGIQNNTDDKVCGEVLELVTMDNRNDTIGEEESAGEEERQNAELQTVIYENNFHDLDKSVNLDNLLMQIRKQVTPKWYQFGLAVGINQETLDEFSNFPPEECIVEMLDLWLRSCERAITWRDVADALKQIGLYQLAERTLKAYKTGKLLTGLGAQSSSHPNLVHPYESMEDLTSKPPNNDNKEFIPPLPPKTYQCTSELH